MPHLPVRMDCEIHPQNDLMTTQHVLNLIARRYLQTVQPSTVEEHSQFIAYLETVRNVLVVSVETGSLIITVECGSLQSLDQLWMDYRTDHLNEMAQKYLVTEDILKECGLLEVKLITTILEEDYKACQKFFFPVGHATSRQAEGDDDGNKDTESDFDDDYDDDNDGDDDDMEGGDIFEDKVLRHRHEFQELPVRAQEDPNKEDTDQGNKQKMTTLSPPSPSGFLHRLCRQGNILAIRSYLQGIDDLNKLEERDGFLGYTPLHEAINSGQASVVRLLLRYGANPNAKTNGFYTPLHYAASMDNTDCVVELLKHNADITSRDEFGKTPYETAMIHRCKKSAEILKNEESNQRKGETEVTSRKTELEHVISTMENLEVDVPDDKGNVGEMRPLPQANLQAESSKETLPIHDGKRHLKRQLTKIEERLTNFQEQLPKRELREVRLRERLRKIKQQENLQRQLTEMKQLLTNYQRQLHEKDLRATKLHEQLTEKDRKLENLERQLTQMEEQLRKMEHRLTNY